MFAASGRPTNKKKSKFKTIYAILWLTGLLLIVVKKIIESQSGRGWKGPLGII